MDNFLDTCVIINYSSYNNQEGMMRSCYDFIIKNKDFILCYYVLDELNIFILKRAIIYKEILTKMNKPSHTIGNLKESSLLSKSDLAYASKLYEKMKNSSFENASKILLEEKTQIEIRIDIFKKKVKELVVKKDEVNNQLVNILHEFIEKYADCKVLASALQAQGNRELFIFVTADNHFDPNGYEFIKNEPRLKEYKFPKLKNLLFEN